MGSCHTEASPQAVYRPAPQPGRPASVCLGLDEHHHHSREQHCRAPDYHLAILGAV